MIVPSHSHIWSTIALVPKLQKHSSELKSLLVVPRPPLFSQHGINVLMGGSIMSKPRGKQAAVGGNILVFQWGQGWRQSRSALVWLGSCGGQTRPPALGFAPWWTPSSPSWACCSRLTCNSRPGTLKPNTTQVSIPLWADLYATKIKINWMLCGRCKSAGEEKRRGRRNNGSCQSHFIVQSLFMNTLSGWKDSRAATHVRLTVAAVLLQ